MKISFKAKAINDIKSLPVAMRTKVENLLFRVIPHKESFTSIDSCRKIIGFTNYYRIRLGDYRIGIEKIDESTLKVYRILHRKDIYRKFP
jgi:mRNA interferase RelE/StbE